ncbi:hypothetical protein [Devosia sp. 2618]|uniref:hypothetical protein n=1 Tax=Devosia sp. 2618 TaxID=3156454 RepID=UPI003398B6D4
MDLELDRFHCIGDDGQYYVVVVTIDQTQKSTGIKNVTVLASDPRFHLVGGETVTLASENVYRIVNTGVVLRQI